MLLLQMPSSGNSTYVSINDIIISLLILGIFLLYIRLCVLVGRYAERRGRSFWGFFFLSFINPILGIFIAVIAGGETEEQREKRIRRETEIRLEMENQYRQKYSQTPPSMRPTDDNDQTL